MATVQESIDVNVPVKQAYNQWTQFEDFPQFMTGVDSIRQLDDTTVHFETSIRGVQRSYDARITAQEPDRLVAWESIEAPRNAGKVRFTELTPGSVRVDVELSWEPEGAVEKLGAAAGLDSRQVAADLERFKKFIEDRDFETGAWRERVNNGEVDSGLTPVTDPDYDVIGTGAPQNTDPDLATEPATGPAADADDASAAGGRRADD